MIDNQKIEKLIEEIFENEDAIFLKVETVRKFLPPDIKKALGINPNGTPQYKSVEQLQPALGKRYKTFTKGLTKYIGLNITKKELIIKQMTRSPGISSKKLKEKLPLSPDDFLCLLNELLEEGLVCCKRIYKDHVVASLHINQNPSNQQDTHEGSLIDAPESLEDRTQKFQVAYNSAGGGEPYVYIHRIRNLLNWKKEDFDQTLEDLARKKIIVLQGGNPNNLSQQELDESYKDRFGYLRITVSWRK